LLWIWRVEHAGATGFGAGRGFGGEGAERVIPLATLPGDEHATAQCRGVARTSGNGTGPSPGLATRDPSVWRRRGFLAIFPF
jgi:hypothetical protein